MCASVQDLLSSIVTMRLSTTALVAIASAAIRQNLITEPVSRLLEMLLFRKSLSAYLLHIQLHSLNGPLCALSWLLSAVANKETSVMKVSKYTLPRVLSPVPLTHPGSSIMMYDSKVH
jgi:hypothetical protein